MSRLEHELRSMRPVAPSDTCRERIQNAIETEGEPRADVPRRGGRPTRALRLLAAAAGVALLAAAGIRLGSPPPPEHVDVGAVASADDPAERTITPVFARSDVIDRSDEGVQHIDGIGPARRYRVRSLHQVEWELADTGERFWDIQPQEHLVFVAVQPN